MSSKVRFVAVTPDVVGWMDGSKDVASDGVAGLADAAGPWDGPCDIMVVGKELMLMTGAELIDIMVGARLWGSVGALDRTFSSVGAFDGTSENFGSADGVSEGKGGKSEGAGEGTCEGLSGITSPTAVGWEVGGAGADDPGDFPSIYQMWITQSRR